MSTPDWDFDQQRAETAWTLKELFEKQGLSDSMIVTLEMQFVPGDCADKQALVKALGMFGYGVTVDDDPDDKDMVQAEVTDVQLTPEVVWLHEERCTKIALERGYLPDGWGFWEP